MTHPVSGPRDVVIGCLMSAGRDVWNSGHKVRGTVAAVADLTDDELFEYVRPFVTTCADWELNGVLIHDGLSPALEARLRSPHLALAHYGRERARANLDRRYFAARDFVAARPEIARLWMIDANDVLFTRHPFEWFRAEDADRVCVGREWSVYSHPGFTEHMEHFPARYRALLQGTYGGLPALNAGQWGSAGRTVIVNVLEDTCRNQRELIEHLGANPPPHDCRTDSSAFGAAVLERYPDRHVTFVLDGAAVEDGRPAPVLHDRKLVMARLAARAAVPNPEPKPRVLFCGGWGYGSIGDDLYRDLWPRLLPECECLMDRWGRFDRWGAVDAVVIGGGGLVNRIDPDHERRILTCAQCAGDRGVPLVFASVGCMPITNDPVSELAAWRPALEGATAVVARSARDADLIRRVAPRAAVSQAPDLCYLVEPAPGRLIPPETTIAVPYSGSDWSARGRLPERAVALCLNPDDLDLCRALYGDDVLGGLTAAECAAVLRDAREVWTARYHGLVLARAVGQTNIRVPRSTWKLDAEVEAPVRTDAARGAVEAVRSAVRPARRS